MRYFLLDEYGGKSSLIYGVIRRSHLKEFSFEKFLCRFGSLGADILIVYWLLGQGKFGLVEDSLRRCTIGNMKHYEGGNAKYGWRRLVSHMRHLGNHMRCSMSFLLLAFSWLDIALLSIWMPYKLYRCIYLDLFRPTGWRIRRALGFR